MLTIESIKDAKATAKATGRPVKVSVGEGVRLNVTSRSATFQLRYRKKDASGKLKEKTLTLGKLVAKTNPTLSKAITRALEEAETAKQQVAAGFDPSQEKKLAKTVKSESNELTLSRYFFKWVSRISNAAQWSVKHYKDMNSKFTNHIEPMLGNMPISRLNRKAVTLVLEPLESKPATYKKVRSLLNMLLEDAVTGGTLDANPIPRGQVSSVAKYKAKKLPAITDIHKLQNLIAGINRINIQPEVRVAALLQAHTALRSKTVVAAKWEEFDLTNAVWRIPRVKGRIKLSDASKYGDYFSVPLSNEVVSLIQGWRETLRWLDSEYLFPSKSAQGFITIESLTKVYKVRLNTDEHCAHGWRSSFSTLAHDAIADDGRGQFRTDVIERCLDHVVGNEVTQAYNRGELLELRRSLMCWWSEKLSGSKVSLFYDHKKSFREE